MVEECYTPEQLDHLHQQLWHCVLQFANFSATQERHRIARDLHDSLGHALTALNFQLQTAMKLCQPNPSQAQEFLTEAHRLVAIATQEVRHSVRALRDDSSESQSLEALVESLVQDFEQTTGILPSVEMICEIAIPNHLITLLYRIIQESLNNTRKYAQATKVEIRIHTTETMVNFMIQDNGRGFDLTSVIGGYGLQGMKERIAIFQGTLSIQSQPGSGCCITAEIPMQLPSMASQVTEKVMPDSKPLPASIEISDWQPLDIDSWQLGWIGNDSNTLELSVETTLSRSNNS